MYSGLLGTLHHEYTSMRYLTAMLLFVVGCSSETTTEAAEDIGLDSTPDVGVDLSVDASDVDPEMDMSDSNRFYAFTPARRLSDRLVGLGSWENNEGWGYGHMVVRDGPDQFLLEKVLSLDFLSSPLPFRFAESIPWKDEQIMVTTSSGVAVF